MLIAGGYLLVQVRLGNVAVRRSNVAAATAIPQATPTQSLEDFVRQAEEAIARGDYRAAIRAYESASRRRPSDPELYRRAARLMVFLGNAQKAEQHVRRALEVSPGHVPSRAVQCMAVEWQGRLAEAIELCQSVVNDAPDYALGHAYLAEAYASAGNFQAARTHAQRAMELDPNELDVVRNMGYVFEMMGRNDTAIRYYRQVLDRWPNTPHVMLALGRLYFATGQSALAVSTLRQLTEVDPENADAFYQLGVVFQTLGEFGQARLALDKAIELNNLHVRALTQRGSLNFQTRNYFGSVEDYTRAISVSQVTGVAVKPIDYVNLGFAYRWIQDCTRAKEAWNIAAVLAPEDETVQEYVRVGYSQCGQ